MSNNFISESRYPNLAEVLNCDGIVEIGKHSHLDSFARLIIDREVIEVTKTEFIELDDLFQELELKAQDWINNNW